MPINSTVPVKAYTGNGVSNSFTYPFKVFAVADLFVTIDGVTKVFGVDYAVTGIGDITGGSVVFTVPPANLSSVILYRQVSYDRLSPDYQEGGDFLSDTLDDDIDRVVAQVQQLARDLGRAIKLPVDVLTDQTIASTAAQRVGKIAGFDSSGNAALFDPSILSAATVSVFMATVLVAANQAAAQTALDVYGKAASDALYIAKAFVAAKGDLIGATANDTPAIITVGSDGLQLTADSSNANGIAYAIRNLERSQCPIYGAVDANGAAAFLTTGAGLRPGLDASPVPLLLGFANGFDAGGNKDLATLLAADVGDILGADLPVNVTSYLLADYSSAGAVTWGSTRIPQQMGETFDKTKQSLLRFAGVDASTSIIDDYGNTWTAAGNAQLDTAVQIDTLNTLLLDGTGDYVTCSGITSLGGGSWTLELKVRWNTLPTAATRQPIFATRTGAGTTGMALYLFNNAGTTKLEAYLSSTNATYDITNGGVGSTTAWATGTTYHITVTYDALAGKYFVYKDGVSEGGSFPITSALRIATTTALSIGADQLGGGSFLNGAVAGFRFSPYCRYPNGTTFTAPNLSTMAVEGAWYSIIERKLYGVTAASASAGVNPTFTQAQRLYAGEADTSGAAVTAVRSYAYKGRFKSVQAFPAQNTTTSVAHNIGTLPMHAVVKARIKTTQGATAENFAVGEEASLYVSSGDSVNPRAANSISVSQSAVKIRHDNAGGIGLITLTGSRVVVAASFADLVTIADRGF